MVTSETNKLPSARLIQIAEEFYNVAIDGLTRSQAINEIALVELDDTYSIECIWGNDSRMLTDFEKLKRILDMINFTYDIEKKESYSKMLISYFPYNPSTQHIVVFSHTQNLLYIDGETSTWFKAFIKIVINYTNQQRKQNSNI